MVRKYVFILLILLISVSVIIGFSGVGLAACRDDCYSNCCGSDSLCQTDDEIKCLSDCLKDCGGDNIPEPPEPEPVDTGETSG